MWGGGGNKSNSQTFPFEGKGLTTFMSHTCDVTYLFWQSCGFDTFSNLRLSEIYDPVLFLVLDYF